MHMWFGEKGEGMCHYKIKSNFHHQTKQSLSMLETVCSTYVLCRADLQPLATAARKHWTCGLNTAVRLQSAVTTHRCQCTDKSRNMQVCLHHHCHKSQRTGARIIQPILAVLQLYGSCGQYCIELTVWMWSLFILFCPNQSIFCASCQHHHQLSWWPP